MASDPTPEEGGGCAIEPWDPDEGPARRAAEYGSGGVGARIGAPQRSRTNSASAVRRSAIRNSLRPAEAFLTAIETADVTPSRIAPFQQASTRHRTAKIAAVAAALGRKASGLEGQKARNCVARRGLSHASRGHAGFTS